MIRVKLMFDLEEILDEVRGVVPEANVYLRPDHVGFEVLIALRRPSRDTLASACGWTAVKLINISKEEIMEDIMRAAYLIVNHPEY